MDPFNCYIIHYTKLTDRKKHLDEEFIPLLKQSPYIKNIIFINEYDKESEEVLNIKEKGSSERLSAISCSKKHFTAWQLFQKSGDEHCLILEDDVIPKNKDTFLKEFNIMIKLIEPKHTCVSFGTGCAFQVHGIKHGFKEERMVRCTDSYIINKNFLEMYKMEGERYNTAIDHKMNSYFQRNKQICYWYAPELVYQGSQKGGSDKKNFKSTMTDITFF